MPLTFLHHRFFKLSQRSPNPSVVLSAPPLADHMPPSPCASSDLLGGECLTQTLMDTPPAPVTNQACGTLSRPSAFQPTALQCQALTFILLIKKRFEEP